MFELMLFFILKQAGSFTYGGLVNHIWSISSDDSKSDINITFLQPFIAHNFSGGYALAVNTEFTEDWDNNLSTGYFHVIGSKVFTLGKQMAQAFIGPRIPYGNGNRANWGFRAGFTLLFPTKTN